MNAAPREIRWLRRIMTELGDAAVRALTHVEADEDDDSDLDRLLRRAMLLLRSRAINDQLSGASAPDDSDGGEDGDDDELDQLLQRALKLLREQLAKNNQCSSSMEVEVVAGVPKQEDGDDELDRLLRRAMLLFAERRQRSLGCDDAETAELDVVWLKSIPSAASPGLTDEDDDEKDEEDDELDEQLHRAGALLRQRVRGRQQPVVKEHEAPVLEKESNLMDWRRTLRLQHRNKVQEEESRKRPRKDEAEVPPERKSKRARCLIGLKQEAQAEPVQTEERSSFDTTASTLETTQSSAEPVPPVEHPAHCVTPASKDLVPEQPQLTCNELELQTLRADNMKLVAENADLHQKLQANNSSDARLVLLLQEQVQRLQQRELELMRDLARCRPTP
ncbi:hypothetical protein KRP22_014646 [Phytophthora ramorum]|uniref:Uncharacterized protein n=1 Tax=Phytophthora ramorum TaxID=164328 RepID=H3GYA7_PHYRM|nr:hypothetical protein KRP23_14162 [Phytophthora ramorum]KAH7495751.1 hypothetical protein KRP22_14422 [Phytophthora ramorum]